MPDPDPGSARSEAAPMSKAETPKAEKAEILKPRLPRGFVDRRAGEIAAQHRMLEADRLNRLGLGGQFVVKVNNRKVLDGVMEAAGLSGDDRAGQRLTVLRAIDKLDRLGVDGVRDLLGAGRKDESGDFTKGAGL